MYYCEKQKQVAPLSVYPVLTIYSLDNIECLIRVTVTFENTNTVGCHFSGAINFIDFFDSTKFVSTEIPL